VAVIPLSHTLSLTHTHTHTLQAILPPYMTI